MNDAAMPFAHHDDRPNAAVLAFSGSSRRGSFNARLLDIAVEVAADFGFDVSVLDLRDLELPVFDPDVAPEDVPRGALMFRQMLSAHDGLLIAFPEYNGSLPPLLKNALDWSSRSASRFGRRTPYRGKIATIMSAAAGPMEGPCGLSHLRSVLSRLGVVVLPGEVMLGSAATAFDGDGLRDPKMRSLVRQSVAELAAALRLTQPKTDGA